MKKLLKQFNFNSDMQYFEYIVESFINGQREQAKELFKAMPKKIKITFLKSASQNWNSGLNKHDLNVLFDLI